MRSRGTDTRCCYKYSIIPRFLSATLLDFLTTATSLFLNSSFLKIYLDKENLFLNFFSPSKFAENLLCLLSQRTIC